MQSPHSLESLPQSLSQWSVALKQFPYRVCPEQGLVETREALTGAYILVWAKELLIPDFAVLRPLVDESTALNFCGLMPEAGNICVLLQSQADSQWCKDKLAGLEFNFDLVVLDKLPDLSQPGVVLMDMDSTTIQIECIDEIAKLAGVGELVI